MVRTGGIGEFIAAGPGHGTARLRGDAAKTDRQGRLAGRGALAVRDRLPAGDPGLRPGRPPSPRSRTCGGSSRMCPFITEDCVNRLKAIGGGVNLTGWRYLAGTPTAERPAVPDDRGQRDPGRDELGRHADRADEPVAARVLRHHRLNALGTLINGGPADHPAGGAGALHPAQPLVPAARTSALGTLEVGRLGDVAVLNQDYFDRRRCRATAADPLRAHRPRRRSYTTPAR